MVQKSYGPFHKSFFQSSSHHNWPKKVVTFCMKISTPNQQHEAAAMHSHHFFHQSKMAHVFFFSEANSVRRSRGALQPQGKKHGEQRDKWDGNNDTPLVRKHNPKNWLEQKIRMLLSIRQNWKWVCGTKHKVLTLNICDQFNLCELRSGLREYLSTLLSI